MVKGNSILSITFNKTEIALIKKAVIKINSDRVASGRKKLDFKPKANMYLSETQFEMLLNKVLIRYRFYARGTKTLEKLIGDLQEIKFTKRPFS